MKFAWTLTLAALLAGSPIATQATLRAEDGETKAAVPAQAITPAGEAEKSEEEAEATFESKLKEALAVARSGGEDELPIPQRYEKAVEMIDQAQTLNPTQAETKQAISLKFSLLMAIDRSSEDKESDTATAYLKGLAAGDDPAIAAHAENMLLSIKLSKLRSLTPEEQVALVEELKAPIIETEPTTRTAAMASTLANSVSRFFEAEEASPHISDLANHFRSVEDKKVKDAASRLIGLSNRIQLPGNPIEITSTTLSGEEIDFASQFKGKMVLVDFWATWCGPCIAEFPNMKKLYKTYHPHGFEIVGISLDDEKETVDEFVEANEIPWTIAYTPRAEGERGWDDANARRYGISGIPTMILVGKDGNVVSLTARGHNLGQLLAEAYPDVKVESEEEKADAEEEADKPAEAEAETE